MSSLLVDTVLDTNLATCISIGEGESTWLDLVESISSGGDIHEVAGLAFRENGKTVFTAQRAFLDLSTLPIGRLLTPKSIFRQLLVVIK